MKETHVLNFLSGLDIMEVVEFEPTDKIVLHRLGDLYMIRMGDKKIHIPPQYWVIMKTVLKMLEGEYE